VIYSYAPADQFKPITIDAEENERYGHRWWCDEGSLTMLKRWMSPATVAAYGEPKSLQRMMLDAGGMCMGDDPTVDVDVLGDRYTIMARHADLFMDHLDNRHVMAGTTHCRLRCPWSIVVLTADTAQQLKDALTAKLPEIEALAAAANKSFSERIGEIQAAGGRVISENVKP
jgi:hypothetical protein